MKQTFKQFIYVIDYNGNIDSDLDNIVKFVNINLSCNKLSIQLLANNFITYIKKTKYLKQKMKLINL